MKKLQHSGFSRRDFLKGIGLSGLTAAAAAVPTFHVLSKPSRQLGGQLKILQWSHFVPQHDKWFDPFAKQWGEANGVEVIVDHINLAEIPAAAAAEIAAGEGHDLIEFLTPPAALEKSLMDMSDLVAEAESRFGTQIGLAQRSSYNPTT
jgi:hypothetical protein